MKIVEKTSCLTYKLGSDEEAIKLIKKVGFDGYDYSMSGPNEQWLYDLPHDEYLKRIQKIRDFADGLGIPCLQTHAPSPDYEDSDSYVKMAKQAIEVTAILGCKNMVLHPNKYFYAEENIENIFSKIIDFAKEKGVIICTENMYKWKDKAETETMASACGTCEDFVKTVDLMNSPNFKACVDVGHGFMINSPGSDKLISALGKDRIACFHIHDVDLINDNHTFPFLQKIDWDLVTKAIKDIGYQGYFTFEADSPLYNYPNELLESCLRLLLDTGKYLVKKIEG